MAFYTDLNSIIVKSGSSKNSILRSAQIDRSTFFQILSGKRLPTDAQFGWIIRFLRGNAAIQQSDLDQLLEQYMQEKLPHDTYSGWKLAKTFIREANEALRNHRDIKADPYPQATADSMTGETEQAVAAFVARQFSSAGATLDFYLSPALIAACQLEDCLANLMGDEAAVPHVGQKAEKAESGAQTVFPVIRQIIDIDPQRGEMEETRALLHNLAVFFRLMQFPKCMQIYVSENAASGRGNQIFPYYMIGKSELLLLGEDGETCVTVRDPALIEQYRRQFERIIQRLTRLYLPVENYMDLARHLFEHNQKAVSMAQIAVAERPCFLFLVDHDMVNKYVPDPAFASFATSYTDMVQSMPHYYALMSESGIEAFRRDHFVSESGMNLTIDDEDMEKSVQKIRELEGQKMYLIPFGDVFIPRWECLIFHPDEVYFSLYANTDCVFRIQHHGIAEVLFRYYDSIRRVMSRSGSDCKNTKNRFLS